MEIYNLENLKVSIIMCVYNERECWLRKSIESILTQTFKEFEFIITLDNPQNLKLEKIILEYCKVDKRIKFLKNNENLGLVKSLNAALEISKAKYIARMDADDIAESKRIEIQYEYLENNPRVDLVGSDIEYIDESGYKINIPTTFIQGDKNIKNRLKYYNCFNHPTWLFRKNILCEIEGYREVKYAEDYDFIIRAITRGKICENINKKLLKYRLRENGISISNVLEQEGVTRIISKKYRNKKSFELNNIKIYSDEEKKSYLIYKNYIKLCKNNNLSISQYIYLIKLILVYKDIRADIKYKIINKIKSIRR